MNVRTLEFEPFFSIPWIKRGRKSSSYSFLRTSHEMLSGTETWYFWTTKNAKKGKKKIANLNKTVMEMQPKYQGRVARVRHHGTFHLLPHNLERGRARRRIVIHRQGRVGRVQSDAENRENEKHQPERRRRPCVKWCHFFQRFLVLRERLGEYGWDWRFIYKWWERMEDTLLIALVMPLSL